jgi:hypothetical protein
MLLFLLEFVINNISTNNLKIIVVNDRLRESVIGHGG